uniref:hypothetical protein n=1 Tax=Prevotella sp. TaxID=59823 RepID=UPI004028F008
MANYCVPYFNIIEHKFAFEEYDDAYKYIDTHRETSMKVIIDLEKKPEANKE